MDRYPEDFTTVTIPLTTVAAEGGLVAPSGPFSVFDFRIYKNGGTTQKVTPNGLTVSSPFDYVDTGTGTAQQIGVHMLVIDTSNDTGDAGFWAAGAVYDVLFYPNETVDGQSVGKWVGKFWLGAAPADVVSWNGTLLSTAGPIPELGITDHGTAQSATGSTLVLRAASAFANNTLDGCVVAAYGSTQGYWQYREISANVLATDTVTVDPAWDVTPSGTITYVVFGGPAATAAETRMEAAVNCLVTGTVEASPTPTNSVFKITPDPVSAVTDQWVGLILKFRRDTTTTALRGQGTDITDGVNNGDGTVTLTVTPLTTLPQAGDVCVIN